jgi:hypothetical protein
MVALYGREMSRRDVAAHAGALSQFAGVRLMTLGDGVERGVRMLEFRTGSGLRFTVLPDRAFDLADCDYKGAAIGWHSPTGFRNPGLHDGSGENGLGWLRSFSGLLVTCGLDHALGVMSEDAAHFHYPYRKTVEQTLHGRVSTVPGRLTAYGEEWRGEECWLFCEGIVQQATVFGEDLQLIRRIEAQVGGNAFVLKDRVVNHGFYRTPHMLLYHISIAHPVLAEGSRYLAPIAHTPFASHAATYRHQGVGYQRMPPPIVNFVEQVWEHEMVADFAGKVPVAVVNDLLGLGFMVETNKAEFPCQFEWQNLHAGHYTLGLEPMTNHILGKNFARDRGELIWLEHDEARSYSTTFSVLDGAAQIAAAEQRIKAIAQQSEDDYPELTGRWEPIAGR